MNSIGIFMANLQLNKPTLRSTNKVLDHIDNTSQLNSIILIKILIKIKMKMK